MESKGPVFFLRGSFGNFFEVYRARKFAQADVGRKKNAARQCWHKDTKWSYGAPINGRKYMLA